MAIHTRSVTQSNIFIENGITSYKSVLKSDHKYLNLIHTIIPSHTNIISTAAYTGAGDSNAK